MKAKEALEAYNKSVEKRKKEIRSEPNGFKRFWMKVWFLISHPWRWLWMQCHDWHFLVLFLVVMAVMSSEVWVFYIIGFVSWGTEFSKWCLGIASACWAFWLGPFTPFIPLCIAITIGIQACVNKIKLRHQRRK